MITAIISIKVVINGPEATAGSILHFLKIIGMKLPAKFATTIENKILILTTIAIFKLCY